MPTDLFCESETWAPWFLEETPGPMARIPDPKDQVTPTQGTKPVLSLHRLLMIGSTNHG